MFVGTAASLILIYLSPTIQVGLLGRADAPFPLRNPALISMPLAFLVAIVVSWLQPEPESERGFDEVARRVHLGEH
jgi:cation/acetate symporter